MIHACRYMVRQLSRDLMMFVCVLAPILMGIVFSYGIPIVEEVLCEYYRVPSMIQPYYRVFDLILAIMTPVMSCFSCVLVALEEMDTGIAYYYFVTPVGKSGYLMSRIGIPTMLSIVYNMVLILVFGIGDCSIGMAILLSLSGGCVALICSLFVLTFAKNKLEGMALIKLCGILILAIPVVYVIQSPLQYIFAIFPTYWLGRVCRDDAYWCLVPFLVIVLVGIRCFYVKFLKKLRG